MSKQSLELKNLYDDFRDANTIKALASLIEKEAKKLKSPIILWKFVVVIHILL
jgi:hydrogenase expression/formation protein HypD